MKESLIFRFKGEPRIFLWIFIPLVLIIYSLIWITLFLMFGWIIKIILVLFLIFTIYLLLKHAIKDIHFYEDNFRVNFHFGRSSLISYKDILSVNEIQQGVFIFSLISIRTKFKINGKQKFPFYCPPSLMGELNKFLENRKLKIRFP